MGNGDMSTFAFTVIVDDAQGRAAELAQVNGLLVTSHSGSRASVEFAVDSEVPLNAALDACAGLSSASYTPLRFDLDLVSLSDIAERVGVSRETARLWSEAKRREGFPAHFTTVGASRIWAWADVCDWLEAEGLQRDPLYTEAPLPVDVVRVVNGMLARRRQSEQEGWRPALSPSAPPIQVQAQRPARSTSLWAPIPVMP